MWVIKTEEEIENSKNKEEYVAGIRITPLKGSIFIFFFIFILEVAFDMIIGKSKGRLYLPSDYAREKVTLSELPSMLPEYFVFSSTMGILFYIILIKFKDYKMYPDTYICQKCHKVKSDDKNYKCECGGEYIKIDKMKWVEDKKKD